MALRPRDAREQTPLEQLTEMNEQLGKVRRKSAKPRDPSASVERFMRARLAELVREMSNAVQEGVLPVVRAERDNYLPAADSVPTTDAWSDRIISALRAAAGRFLRGAFESEYERLARRTVSMAEAESTQAFVASVNRAVGVDLRSILSSEGLSEYIDAAVAQNVQLIRSVSEQYFTGIESAVLGGIRDGDTPSKIAANIQAQTGTTRRRAALIARDQSAKLTSEITERRQRQSGVRYYRSVDSGDIRVTGRPDGKYPNAKISCWGIARRDIGFGPGVYRWDQGARWGGQSGLHPGRHHINCRCTASPVFEWELPNRK